VGVKMPAVDMTKSMFFRDSGIASISISLLPTSIKFSKYSSSIIHNFVNSSSVSKRVRCCKNTLLGFVWSVSSGVVTWCCYICGMCSMLCTCMDVMYFSDAWSNTTHATHKTLLLTHSHKITHTKNTNNPTIKLTIIFYTNT